MASSNDFEKIWESFKRLQDQGYIDSGLLPVPLDLVACSEGFKNTDYESMTPEMVIAKQNS